MKELTSVILCRRWCAKPVSSARANTEQQAQLVFISACWQAPGEGGINPLSVAQWDCANASHGSAVQTQGQFGNCLCAGHGTRKGTTMQALRAYRAPQETLGPREGCTCICTDNSSSFSWSWSSTASASQWTSLTRRKGLWNCDLLTYGGPRGDALPAPDSPVGGQGLLQ